MAEVEAERRWAEGAGEGRSPTEQHLGVEPVLPAGLAGLAGLQHSTAGSIARSCREQIFVSKR